MTTKSKILGGFRRLNPGNTTRRKDILGRRSKWTCWERIERVSGVTWGFWSRRV